MPNWCSNRLQIIGATADLLDFVNKGIETSLNGATSFEKVKVTKKLESLEELNENPDNFPNFSAWLPMPKILLDIASMQEDERRRFYIEGSGKKSDFKFSDELTALIEKAKEEIGTDNWYSWAIGHWAQNGIAILILSTL